MIVDISSGRRDVILLGIPYSKILKLAKNVVGKSKNGKFVILKCGGNENDLIIDDSFIVFDTKIGPLDFIDYSERLEDANIVITSEFLNDKYSKEALDMI